MKVKIGDKWVGEDEPCFVIAEIYHPCLAFGFGLFLGYGALSV
ncbi:unnamed protein product [marine sediment metagenome]|uniref:Uncharacterized protein n=1 Tax=marine sediment metagenome TaxID=412755 RepID=X1BSQ2_9ZZZZ